MSPHYINIVTFNDEQPCFTILSTHLSVSSGICKLNIDIMQSTMQGGLCWFMMNIVIASLFYINDMNLLKVLNITWQVTFILAISVFLYLMTILKQL